MAVIALVALPQEQRVRRECFRLFFHTVCGFAICLICLINTNKPNQKDYLESAWMLPTICLLFFSWVFIKHVQPWHHSEHFHIHHHYKDKKLGEVERGVLAKKIIVGWRFGLEECYRVHGETGWVVEDE
jgi:hypothetical protein